MLSSHGENSRGEFLQRGGTILLGIHRSCCWSPFFLALKGYLQGMGSFRNPSHPQDCWEAEGLRPGLSRREVSPGYPKLLSQRISSGLAPWKSPRCWEEPLLGCHSRAFSSLCSCHSWLIRGDNSSPWAPAESLGLTWE